MISTSHRLPRPMSVALVAAIAASGLVFSAPAAQAETRSGDVTVTIPSRIVIDGSDVPVRVSSSSMYSSLDRLWANLYNGDDLQGLESVSPNTAAVIKNSTLTPGSIVAKADLPQTDCSYGDDPCHFDSDDDYSEFIDGLTIHDSAPATAKYGSKVALTAVRTGTKSVWTATVQRYGTAEWTRWKHVVVTIGPKRVRTDAKGVATWTEKTSASHRYKAAVAETAAVWGSTSTAARPSKPARISSASSASTVARAVAKRVDSARKVVTLTKRNDSNKLLGRSNGYTSAAVLYDTATSCSGGPGVDCGATIEKFSSAAKAAARKRYIQAILDAAPVLGEEHDTVHGTFLIRVSGDLTSTRAKAYKRAFLASFK